MKKELHLIVGLGLTGMSCAHYLAKLNIPFALHDTRVCPPFLAEFQQNFPQAAVSLGPLNRKVLADVSCLVVSPGVSIRQEVIQSIIHKVPVIGDIELFSRAVHAPVVAITGTNAKSTVTTLVAQMADVAGLKVAAGGNLGPPALSLLEKQDIELFVLELSSFQLETTFSLKPRVAAVLNVTPDHMDRYVNLEDYANTKRHIYSNCRTAVFNRDDTETQDMQSYGSSFLSFTLSEPGVHEFGLRNYQGEEYLAYENQLLLKAQSLSLGGRHYYANALAALAIGAGAGLPTAAMLKTLESFKGLPHRCQWVRERAGVVWYNDSKGTNVGAALAAILGLGNPDDRNLILIVGGVGKNADFSPLVAPTKKYVKIVLLIGEAAPLLAKIFQGQVETKFARSMEEAVILAEKAALPGDRVLLSPACASLDMFKNFEQRGEVFMKCVNELP